MRQTFLHRLWLLAIGLIGLAVSAQAQDLAQAKETALRFLQNNPEQFNLTRQDVSDVRITDAYVTEHNGVTHVWVQQQHAGIPVYNALFGLHVKPNGEVLHLGHRFLPDLSRQVNTTLPSLNATRAVEIAVTHLGFSPDLTPAVSRKINDRNWVFEAGKVSRSEITVEACYDRAKKGLPRLAWKLFLDQANSSDMWTITVDAQTGQIINQFNHTVYCKVGHLHREGDVCSEEESAATTQSAALKTQNSTLKTENLTGSVDESYRVFALPVESPVHGGRTLVVNPADPIASPYGWHDENGQAGPEYTYTRGNNVRAYEDRDFNGTPVLSEYVTGTNYTFDFPYDPNGEPAINLEAAVTNLFYMNNTMHDRYYRFGFNEQAGNFQHNNYGRGGLANDAVRAEGLDGGGENNANFTQVPDGTAGRMQMYLWSGQSGNIVTVNGPTAVTGTYYAQAGAFGGQITSTPITGEAVVTDDGSGSDQASWNCQPPVNSLQGKIAIIDRGNCEFGAKALRAQQNGAVGCIICNFADATLSMGAGAVGAQVTIPVVMMTLSACEKIRQYAGNGLNISLVRPTSSGPNLLDGDFDNGIISHEYAHGISGRLTGGPSNPSCLNNEEQMGEGWSDFFALVNTVKPSDVAEQRRGMGTFVFRQPNDGTGIRRVPYSTDMSIDPHTLATVALHDSIGRVHQIGEVWATVVWDMYWAFVEKYGYDADWSNINSGNYRAIQLVMDGLKLQPCSPGFLDGRDAIIAADFLNYDGVDTCLIVSVFARRGMGLNASQGDSDDAFDAVENFDAIPTCIKELKITKETSTPTLTAGENAEFTIKVVNHKDETAEGVVVSDPLPPGLTLVSASNGGTNVGGVVTWNLGDMPTLQEITLTYTAKSDPGSKSLLYFRDEMEEEGDVWVSLTNKGSNFFSLQDQTVKVGSLAWKASAPITETDQVLWHYAPTTISGTQPILRFWHNYDTEPLADAGFLEIQIVGESTWRRFPREKVFRNGYNGGVQYGTFAIPFLNGFFGNSNGWIQSYFDMSDYAGKDITFQFRFGTDDNTAPPNSAWYVDQVDVMDMLNYDSEACVRSDAGDVACARAPARGVIVEPGMLVGTDEPTTDNVLGLRVQPNPATNLVALSFGASAEGLVHVQLTGADGRVALQQRLNSVHAGQVFPLDIQNLPAGLYIIQVESSIGRSVAKVVKQ